MGVSAATDNLTAESTSSAQLQSQLSDSGKYTVQQVANELFGDVKHALSASGIVYSRTLGGDNRRYDLPADFYAWMPTAHHRNPEVLSMLDEFLAFDYEKLYLSARQERLFYLWGHTYEFDGDDNWDLVTQICERVAAHSDVWCATNGEIYEYVTAYNSLVYSADNATVYNPTLKTVWFDRDGTLYRVAPGETLTGLKT